MLNDAESLDEVFSFLSQIDLPPGLAPFEDEQHLVDSHRPMELLSSPVVWASTDGCGIEELFKPQTFESTVSTPDDDDDDTTLSTCSPKSSEDSALTLSEEKPKRIRISRKQQIDSLRGEVQDLNGQLQALLQQWQQDSTRDQDGQIRSRRTMWQEIAARQLERREKSELENAQLRDMLQVQTHEARNLRRVLKRRTKIEMMEDMLGMKRHKICVPEDNPQVFEDMLQDMDEIYVHVDALLVEKGLYDLPCPGRRRDAKRNLTNGNFLEILQRQVVPFDIRTTEKAVWGVMRQIIFQDLPMVQQFTPRVQFHAHHVEETQNTMKTSFYVDVGNLGDVKGAQFRKVVRKYVEKDRVVLVCKNLMQPIVHERGNTSGFYTKTTLRIVLREENPSGEFTFIDSHFSATRHDQGLTVTRVVRSPANLDIGVAAWDEAIARLAHHVESLAIDDSCTKISTPVASSFA